MDAVIKLPCVFIGNTVYGRCSLYVRNACKPSVFVSQNLPPIQTPEVFGMHDNVSISKELQETRQLFDNVLLTQGRSHRGARSSGKTDDRLYLIANDILKKAVISLVYFSASF
jgi:hypothetical protein